MIFQQKEENTKEAKIEVFLTIQNAVKEIKKSNVIRSDRGDKLLSLSYSKKASEERST